MDIHLRNVQIKTDRLLIRPWVDSDLAAYFAYASLPAVGEMAGWKAHATIDEARIFFRGGDFKTYSLAIEHLADGAAIGHIGIGASWAAKDARFRCLPGADMFYVLHPSYWGAGLAHEAASALISYCFAHMDIEMLTCGHFAHNLRSKRVVEKCGFAFDHEAKIFVPQLDTCVTQLRYVRPVR